MPARKRARIIADKEKYKGILFAVRHQVAWITITEESLEGMNAFLEGRKPRFQEFRMRSKREMDRYLAGNARDLNVPPSMRKR